MDSCEFDKWAREYDESIISSLNSFPFIGYFDVLAEVQKLVEPDNDMKIMDVGIGTGLLSTYLATQGCTIYGVDFSEVMIQKARQKIPDGLFDQVDVIQNHLGKFTSDKFDRIISSYWIHHLDNRQKLKFLKQCANENLNPNGKIIIADIGFETAESFEIAKKKYENEWDPSEYYLCGGEFIKLMKNNEFIFDYCQISECAGILSHSDKINC